METITINNQQMQDILENAGGPNWMRKNRLDALEHYRELPWPNTRMEEWRRTNISHIDIESFSAHCWPKAVENVPAKEKQAGHLLFDNSQAREKSLQNTLSEQGVIFTTLAEAVEKHSELLQKHFLQKIKPQQGKFQAMNASFWTHGIFLYVPKFVEISEPFHVEFHESGQKALSLPHVLIVLETGAKATFVQKIQSAQDSETLVNQILDIQQEQGSCLKYVCAQQLNIQSSFFFNGAAGLKRDAQLHYLNCTLGGALVKTNFASHLLGQGSQAVLHGVNLADDYQHVDHRTMQIHETDHAYSNVLYKSAINDKARSIYQGMIKVYSGAQKTDAYQSSHNLLLSDAARADSIPGLEIEADDVRCSHGATVGQIDEEQLFYLMARGIRRQDARKMIVAGFFEDVIKDVGPVIAEDLLIMIENKLSRRKDDGPVD